jgi:hypothetical protein
LTKTEDSISEDATGSLTVFEGEMAMLEEGEFMGNRTESEKSMRWDLGYFLHFTY